MGLCINFLKLTVSFTLIFLVFNWFEMCEREKGLIGNYFSESSLTTEHIKKLLDVLGTGSQKRSVKRGNIFVLVSSALFLSKLSISMLLYLSLQWSNSTVLQ